jgi:hypothetical protein
LAERENTRSRAHGPDSLDPSKFGERKNATEQEQEEASGQHLPDAFELGYVTPDLLLIGDGFGHALHSYLIYNANMYCYH